jgi:hypothetical protein
MSSGNSQVVVEHSTFELETSGDLRRLMKNIALGVMHGDMKVEQAAICVKACEQINVSLYSEIKHAALIQQMGREAPELGALPLFGTKNRKLK